MREALLDNCIFFYTIFPLNDEKTKEEYIQRYIERGNDSTFVKLISDNWSSWIKDTAKSRNGVYAIEMTEKYLERAIEFLVSYEETYSF